MNWNKRIRQLHRWLSIAFTLAVIVNIAAIATAAEGQQPAFWIGLLALVPLILLLVSGLYMFVLPYVARRRGGAA